MSSSLRGCWFSTLLTPSRTPAELSPTSLSEIQAFSTLSFSWVERVTCVRALESFGKHSENPTLEHLLILLNIFWSVFYSWSPLAPRHLEVAWKLSIVVWQLWEVCNCKSKIVEHSIYCLGDRCEGGVDWNRSQSPCGLPQQCGRRPALVMSWTTG
jgi:hypothetical protein